MRIEILDGGQQDLVEGFLFYDEREPGLGSYFLDCLCPSGSLSSSARREFLKAATGAAAFTTSLFTGKLKGADDKVNVAFIGTGAVGAPYQVYVDQPQRRWQGQLDGEDAGQNFAIIAADFQVGSQRAIV